MASAEKVDAEPTIPYTDFTSEIPYDVIAIATLEFSMPSIINDSFRIKSPVFS
jgi:hypothetical protein